MVNDSRVARAMQEDKEGTNDNQEELEGTKEMRGIFDLMPGKDFARDFFAPLENS